MSKYVLMFLLVISIIPVASRGQALPFGSHPMFVVLAPTVTTAATCTGLNASGFTANCTAGAAGAAGDVIVATSKVTNNSGLPVMTVTSPDCTVWQPLVTPNSNGTSIHTNAGMYGCILTATATPTVTVTWTGATVGTTPFTDVSVQILHSTATWNNPLLDRTVSQVNSSASTSCPTGSGGTTNNPFDYWIAVCENFNFAETWGTMTGYTNNVGASRNTAGVYTKSPGATGALSATIPMSASDTSTGMLVALQATNAVNCTGCTLVQTANSANENPNFDHISLSAVTPGNTLVYFVYHTNWSGSGVTTMSDSTGVNLWYPCGTNTGGATTVTMTDLQFNTTMGMSCFYSPNIAVTGGTLTGQPTTTDCASGCTNVGGTFVELSGPSVWDGSSHTASTATSTTGSDNMNCGSITTTKANDFMLCFIQPAGITVSAGTLPSASTLFSTLNGYAEDTVWTGVGTTAQTQTLSSGGGVPYGGIGIAFK